MRAITIMAMLLACVLKLSAQSPNNEFEYDREDLNLIFKELGINAFKFPVKQPKGQALDIIIEEYEDKKLLNSKSIVDKLINIFDIDAKSAVSHIKPEKDTIITYRVLFTVRDSTVNIRISTPRMGGFEKFNLEGKGEFGFNSGYFFDSYDDGAYMEVKEPQLVAYLYANSADAEDPILHCTTGLSKERLINECYYLILVSLQPYEYNK